MQRRGFAPLQWVLVIWFGWGLSAPASAQSYVDTPAIDAMALARKDPKYCNDSFLFELEAELSIADLLITKKNLPLYQTLLRCAKELHAWDLYLLNLFHMMKQNSAYITPDAIPYAYIKQGKFELAEEAIETLQKIYPDRIELTEVYGYLLCEQELFQECLAVADDVLLKNKKTKDKKIKKQMDQYSHSLRMKAQFYLGNLEEFEKELKIVSTLEPEYAKKYEKKATFARKHKLFFSATTDTVLPLGTYHLYSENPKNDAERKSSYLVEFYIHNADKKARDFRADVVIDGVTQPSVKEITLQPGEKATVDVVPPLKFGFDINSVRASLPSQITIKFQDVTETSTVLYEQSIPITILPRTFVPLFRTDGESEYLTWGYLAAWVTPNAKEIQKFLSTAKSFKKDQAFAGTQTESLSQVKALYEAVHASGVSYVVNNGIHREGLGRYHEARLPVEVLTQTNAQCLEGSLLFASLLAALRLEPVIVLVPGHAFVAWKRTPHDPKPGSEPDAEAETEPKSEFDWTLPRIGARPEELGENLYFLETTMVHNASFEDALAQGRETFVHYRDTGHFETDAAFLLDVTELQNKLGYKPQPY